MSFEEQINSKDKYLENKPLLAADMSANNVRGQDIFRKNKMNIRPRSEVSREKGEIFKTTFQPRTYQPTCPPPEGCSFVLNPPPPINFSISELTAYFIDFFVLSGAVFKFKNRFKNVTITRNYKSSSFFFIVN